MPISIIASSRNFRPNCMGVSPPASCWAHICGSDLIRGADGTVYVLEDNLRVPSGVSYMIENRQVVKRVFPELFDSAVILPVDDYPGASVRHARGAVAAAAGSAGSGGADAGHLQLRLL